MRLGAVALAILSFGCGAADTSLMPFQVGAKSRYEVSAPFNNFIGEVRVDRKCAVAGTDGYVLSGPTGESRMAWKGDTLVAEQMSNTRFSPAIPLVVDVERRVQRTWKGTVEGYWGKFEAAATLEQAWVSEYDGKKIRAVKSTLTVLAKDGKSIKLVTLFQPGVGIASQSQALGGDSIVKIERLSGP